MIIKTIIETILRFFPFPTKTGLYIFGHPGPESPVFVTCNFDLTVRRVSKILRKMDCYLLVCPSKGVNVWCAAAGGMFNANSVISVVKTSSIGDKVNHHTLVLPQFSAPGIDTELVQERTGWRCKFGPAYAKDIPAYISAGCTKTVEMSRARFPLSQRLEMAVMWAGMLSIPLGVIMGIFWPGLLPSVLLLVWGMSLISLVLFEPIMRTVPGPVGLIKMMVVGVIVVTGLVLYSLVAQDWPVAKLLGWSGAVIGMSLFLGFDFEGLSPLYASGTVSYWGKKWPWYLKLWSTFGFAMEEFFTLGVDADKCTGCGTCVQVCPKGVFELVQVDRKKKSLVSDLKACEQCTACVKQCPVEAILAQPPILTFRTGKQRIGV